MLDSGTVNSRSFVGSPALFLLREISSVISAGREEDSWSEAVPEVFGSDESNKLEDSMNSLREEIFQWTDDWSNVTPIDYLGSFLEIIKSPETSGKLTGAALQAIQRILEDNLLASNKNDEDVSTAVQNIAEAVTQCKFESKSAGLDECILDNILDIFTSLVKSQQGYHLSHENLISIFQACYRIGHMKTERGKHCSAILTQSSQRSMKVLVREIFSGLHEFNLSDEFGQEEELLSTPVSRLVVDNQDDDDAEEIGQSNDEVDLHLTISNVQDVMRNHGEWNQKTSDFLESTPNQEHRLTEVVSLEIQTGTFPQEEKVNKYGMSTLAEVLAFIISMIGSKPSKNYPELPLAGIELLTVCIQAAGETLAFHPLLTNLLKHDLFKALFSVSDHGSDRCFAGMCQLSVALYTLYKSTMFPQIQALLELLLIPIAEGSVSTSFPRRRAAMEAILDFCRQKDFLTTVFVNVDCRIGNENLFKRIVSLLSKSGFVADSEGVPKFHSISMDGMKSVFEAIKEAIFVESLCPDVASDVEIGLKEYLDIWTPLCEGRLVHSLFNVNGTLIWQLKREKSLKVDIASIVEEFNENQEAGIQFCQKLKLLPSPLTAQSVANFLRACPGLSKSAVGEVLGERERFYDEVRDAFCGTFDFRGMRFDVALRLFMDAFRPPGEGQKIDRIVQSFGKRYYEQCPKSGLKSSDSAYVLAFSVIMLNTDLHNSQNKRKMTLEDFARINRNTNEGDPMPQELLSSIYGAISADEFKISSECSASDISHQNVFWMNLLDLSKKARGKPIPMNMMEGDLNILKRDMFGDCWGPSLGSITNILDSSQNPKIVKKAVETLKLVADLSYKFKIDGVIDQILESLSRYTVALTSESKPLLAYGGSVKGRTSVEAIFKISDLYGDSLRRGWKYVVSTVMKVFLAGLLTPEIISVDGESAEQAKDRMPKPKSRAKGPSSSIFTRAINSLISIEADGDLEYANSGGEMLVDLAEKSISLCSIQSLVSDSKFLVVDSLVELINAIVSSGNASISLAREGMPPDTAELALELLFSLSLRNRDRISLIWPQIHEFLAICTSQESEYDFTQLNGRAIKGLMRICQRLLPYKEDIAGMLLGSLSLIGAMHPTVVWELSPSFTADLITLLSQSAPHIRTETGWRTIAILIRISASREEVLPYSLQALQLACRNPEAITVESFIPLLETCLQLIDAFKTVNPGIAAEFLECADSLFSWLPTQNLSKNDVISQNTEALLDLWLTSVGILTKGLCREQSKDLRHISIAVLHRTLLASSSLNLPADMWVQTLREMILPLVSDISKNPISKKNMAQDGGETLQMVINMLIKVLLKYVPSISSDNDFGALWEGIFSVLADCARSRNTELREILEEDMKNLLKTLLNDGTLTEAWVDGSGNSLWEITWRGANAISPTFQHDLAISSIAETMDAENVQDQIKQDSGTEMTDPVDIPNGQKQADATKDQEELEPPTCKQT